MTEHSFPRLRSVNKIKPAYPLNKFPKEFSKTLCENVVYLLATRSKPEIEGKDWEKIFADCIEAEWKPSNVGLDDIVLDQCAWGAKTVKIARPFTANQVRLISGRNSPIYSFGEKDITSAPADHIGKLVLEIWNARVSSIRELYQDVRTVVLIRSHNLRDLVVFEYKTIRYDPELYTWTWNKNGNLIGLQKSDQMHKFTWQPHGSQFTLIEDIPEEKLSIQITKEPEPLSKSEILASLKFDSSWFQIK